MILLAMLIGGGVGSVWAADQIAAGLTGTAYTDSGLANGTIYYDRIAAADVGGTSTLSDAVGGTPTDVTPPPVPGPVTVSDPGLGRRLDLSWGASAAADLAGYYLYRDVSPTGDFSTCLGSATLPGYTDTGLSDGVTYYYRVTAFDHDGNESGPATASGIPHDVTPPSVPRDLAVIDPQIGTELKLDWSANSESDLAGYNLYRDTTADGTFATKVNTDPLGVTTYADKGLTRSTPYFYKIEAVDTTGNRSALSTAVSGTPVDKTPPIPPGGLSIVDLHTGRDLNLSWTANTTDDDLTGYNLYRSTSSTGPFAKVNTTLLDGRITSYRESGLPRDQTFWYYLTAVDQTGNESPPANRVSVTPVDLTPPMRPDILGVNDPGNGVALITSWISNAADDLAGFNLYKSPTQSGTDQKINTGLVTGTTYSDSAVTIGAFYWYRVSAVDRYGNESALSETAYGTPTDKIPPTTPATVTVTDPGTSGSLWINWSPSPQSDTAGYHIWYSSASAGPYLKANATLVPAPPFVHYGLADGIPVYYRVSALDRYGNESAQTPSAGAVGTPTDQVPPSVLMTSPPSGEPQFGTGRPITVTFARPIDPASITTAVFSVTPADGRPVVPTASSYSASTRAATFTMPALIKQQGYTATLSTGVKNAFGAAMTSNYVWTFTTGSSAYASPHGNFLAETGICALCHATHTAAGPEVIRRTNETAVCFYCHDGTQADSNIAQAFSTNSGNISRHPVPNTPAVQNGLIRCSDCHNSHGDKKPDKTLFPKLLRSTDGTIIYHQGNGFCLACHGTSNRNFNPNPNPNPNSYANTAGDHTRANAAHYDGNLPVLWPASGTEVTCVQCHDQHAAPVQRLLTAVEENACFACHNTGTNSMSGRNIVSEFGQDYKHDITGATGAKVECSSCHGPHTVARADYAAGGSSSQISNPANTKEDMAQVAGSTAGYIRVTQFCLTCHNSTPPQVTSGATTLVPYSVVFPDRVVTTNAGSGGGNTLQRAWDKSAYTGSTHYQKGIGCNECHNSHGSPYPLLSNRAEDTAAAAAQGVCGRCHSGNPPAPYSSAQNVFADLTRTGNPSDNRYRHPTLYTSGRHSDTEDYTAVNRTESGNQRHAECLDCHDPHNDRPYTPVPAPSVTGPVRNTSGVAVNFGAATWATWNPSQNQPVMTFVNPILNQYELCLKCHTAFSWQSSPPVPGGLTPDTDVAKEFNPNNPSYHAVIGDSKIGTFTADGQTYRYGKFAAPGGDPATRDSMGNGWTATSRLYCEDCHRSSGTSLRGSHGSSYWYILRAPWNRNSGEMGQAGTGTAGTAGDICFKCHDYSFYAGGNNGSVTERSAFSADGEYNLHAEHAGRGCTACHVTVAHGWKIRGLLANKSAASDPAIPGSGGDPSAPSPYYDGSWLSIRTWKRPGNWTRADCGDCHAND